jgi:phosphoribosylaminoimidazolecarboxamide formyltransferase/IMP cyclohydrolase
MKVQRALLSVSDKAGLIEFAAELAGLGIELISTGGTANALASAGLPVTSISDVTGFPEMLEGRVKTLHPAVHGGLLADRAKPEHMKTIAEHGIKPIDLVVVNLYPFAQTIAKPGVSREEAIENIDIGGPSMIRSAAKNHASVAVVVSPQDYPAIIDELHRQEGELSLETRERLAAQAFAHTSAYDALIAGYLRPEDEGFPTVLPLAFSKVQDLRYGENPHQKAAFYREDGAKTLGIANAKKRNGKELSFNNIYDIAAAYDLAQEFARDQKNAFACIIKHTNPCGAALATSLEEAFQRARAGDPISAYGGIVALTRTVDAPTAEAITGPNSWFEAIIAPGYDEDAFQILTTKKKWGANLMLLELANRPTSSGGDWEYKRVAGGLLVQTRDDRVTGASDLETVTRRGPSSGEVADLLFAWTIVKHVKSNAIVVAKNGQLLGVGAGQMNRVQSVRLAVAQAGEKAKGAVLASDALFPFDDGPKAAGQAGITAIIQPGGSKKDEDSIAMADSYNIAMVFTGVRHFRH